MWLTLERDRDDRVSVHTCNVATSFLNPLRRSPPLLVRRLLVPLLLEELFLVVLLPIRAPFVRLVHLALPNDLGLRLLLLRTPFTSALMRERQTREGERTLRFATLAFSIALICCSSESARLSSGSITTARFDKSAPTEEVSKGRREREREEGTHRSWTSEPSGSWACWRRGGRLGACEGP